jgi:hypothetical protein
LIKKEEEETMGQLRDRQVLAFARASVPGPRALYVHIKVEDTDGEQGGGGAGQEATGGERHDAGEELENEEEEEEEKEAEDEEEADEGQQREQHSQAPSVTHEGRMEAGADAVAPPRRARPPPGTYADSVVELDTDEDYEEQEEEQDEEDDEDADEEEEKTAPARGKRTHAHGDSLNGRSNAVRPQSLPAGALSEPGSPRGRLWAPRRVADNDDRDEAGVVPKLVNAR